MTVTMPPDTRVGKKAAALSVAHVVLRSGVLVFLLTVAHPAMAVDAAPGQSTADTAAACAALVDRPDLTLLRAEQRTTAAGTAYCYVRGSGPRSIGFHVELPVVGNWNGRLVYLGDGGADGDLDSAPFLLDAGYAYVNSNMGHDDGVEGRAFGYHDVDSEIDFAWRAQHLSLAAAKRTVLAFYGRSQDFSYHFGCSTGGRQGLLAAQILPDDYDGIVAGAPGHLWFSRMAHRVAMLQRLFADDFAGNPVFDADGDGVPEKLDQVARIEALALAQCDAADGIEDGLIEPPLCEFDPRAELSSLACAGNKPTDDCLTAPQIEAVVQMYEGSRNSNGLIVYPGAPVGSESFWPDVFLPHAGNDLMPYALVSAAYVMGYQFYADDPGVIPADLANVSRQLSDNPLQPEWGWWEFDLDDLATAVRTPTFALMQGDNADLSAYLRDRGGKLLMFHGWADAMIPPGPTIDYFNAVVADTFGGSKDRAADHLRLYMVPGMGHCRGGPGPQPEYLEWLTSLTRWVEQGEAPQAIVGHSLDPQRPNERPLCPYPQRAVYTGPSGKQNDSANWVGSNFTCR